MKEFWSYLYDDGHVRALGMYDHEKEWNKLFAKAVAVGEGAKAEPVFPMSEDDLIEVSSNLQDAYNTKNGHAGNDWVMIGTFIDAKDIPLLYKLARQHKDVEFLEMLASECMRARKVWKGKK